MKSHTRTRLVSYVLAFAVAFSMMAAFAAPNASAAGTDSVSTFAGENGTLIGFGALILGGVAVLMPSLGQKKRTYAAIGAIVLAGLFILGQQGAGTGLDDTGPTPPGVTWGVQLATTLDGDLDASSEVLDSQGFTAGDGGTPDLNCAVQTLGTNTLIDESAGTYTGQSDSDDDLARSAVGFQEIDCPILSWTIALEGTIDLDGGGVDDSVTHKARLVSVGPPTFMDANQTTMPVLFYDSDMGWECAFLTEGNIWVSAFDTASRYQLPYPPTSGGGWVAIGSHAGAGAGVDQGNFACVFDTTTGSPAGYTVPPAAGNIEWSAVIQVGSESNYRTLTFNWVLNTRT